MILLLLLFVFVFAGTEARTQGSFYQGKTITVIAGASAGSAYDLYARLMAQFMGKHMPVNPNFIVQNMTGAGSIIGANYLYNVSKSDGLTINASRQAKPNQRATALLRLSHLAYYPSARRLGHESQ